MITERFIDAVLNIIIAIGLFVILHEWGAPIWACIGFSYITILLWRIKDALT